MRLFKSPTHMRTVLVACKNRKAEGQKEQGVLERGQKFQLSILFSKPNGGHALWSLPEYGKYVFCSTLNLSCSRANLVGT